MSGVACGGKPPPRGNQAPLVSVISPSLSEVPTTITFNGTINARDEMPISVEGEGGRIAAVLVEVGDTVKRGQVLARLSTAVAQPQVASLAAALEEARTSAALSTAEYKRAQAVAASGALSAEEIERRRGAAANADARVKSAAAQLSEARARLGRTDIRAPSDGLVLTRNAEVGQTATVGGEPLFRLGRGGEIEMRGRVAEQDLPQLTVGQPAKVYVTGVKQPFDGKVRLLGAVIDPDTRLGSMRIELAQSPLLRPGAFARGEVTVRTEQLRMLPQTAVLTDADANYVLVIDDEKKVRRKAVTVGGTRAGGVVIDQGLSGDERIVATAAAFLTIGETVRIAGEPESAPAAVAARGDEKPKS